MWDMVCLLLVAGAGLYGWRKGLFQGLITIVSVGSGVVFGGRVGELLLSPNTIKDVVTSYMVGITAVTVVIAGVLHLAFKALQPHLPAGVARIEAPGGALLKMTLVLVGLTSLVQVLHTVPVTLLPSSLKGVTAGTKGVFWLSEQPPFKTIAARTPRLLPVTSLQTPLQAPPAQLAATSPVNTSAQSVVKIKAYGCPGRVDTGSGWALDAGTIITAAHVVSGANEFEGLHGGRRVKAELQGVDPERDIAVLAAAHGVPTLQRANAQSGGVGAAIGYPGGGRRTVQPVRMGGTSSLWLPSLYDQSILKRNVLSFRGDVRPGNSGGPLVDDRGWVVGVVFGTAAGEAGFALPIADLFPLPKNQDVGACLDTSALERLQ
jgi:Trypsin-like peptidase domain